jgi:hypothetical protein
MEFALINNNSLILGPIGFNIRMINSELEDLELEDRVTSQNYLDLPIHFSDGQTHLVTIEKIIPQNDPKYHNIGNFSWEIIKENNIPTLVKLTYSISDKTLDEVKEIKKRELIPERKEKENTIITVDVDGESIKVSTSREERAMLSSKISSSPGSHIYKFLNTWKQVDLSQLQLIISQIDSTVQAAFDWEFAKIQEIDACTTIDEVYNVVIREPIIEI